MWKIGPECAAQHPKWDEGDSPEDRVPERVGRGHAPARRRRPSSARRRGRAVAPETPVLGPVREIPHAHDPDDPGEPAEQGEGRPPSKRRDEATGGGGHQEDAAAHAPGDDSHGRTPARGEPARGRRRERDVEGAGADRPEDPERGVELSGRVDLAGQDERRAQEAGADPDHAPGGAAVREGSPGERAHSEDDPVDEGHPGDQGSRPAELLFERAKEHGQGEDRAGADGDEGDRRGEHDPAVEDAGIRQGWSGRARESGLYASRSRSAQRHAVGRGILP